MDHFLWLALVLIILGLFWLRRKNLMVTSLDKAWPTSAWSREKLQDKLLLADPWEVATWLTATFQTKDDLWPKLQEVIGESGLEGVYIGAAGQGSEQRSPAIKALGLIGSEVSLPVLLKALSSKDEEVSLEATEAIKMLRLQSSSDSLIELLVTGQGAVPTRAASILISLGSLAQESIFKALPQVSAAHKAILIEILGEMGQKELLPKLAPYLDSEDSSLRQRTVQAIGTIGSASACSYLLPLVRDKDWKVRAEAAKFLGSLGCEEAIAGLKALCDDPAWHVQVNAKEALEELGVTLED